MEYVITFKNTNFAVKAERCLLEQKQRITVMPLPAQISAGCGICLRLLQDDIKPALAALSCAGIDHAAIYSRVAQDKKYVYAEVNESLFA